MKKLKLLMSAALLVMALEAQAKINTTLECVNIGPATVQTEKGQVETKLILVELTDHKGSAVSVIAVNDPGLVRGKSYSVTVDEKADASAVVSLPVVSKGGPAQSKPKGPQVWSENFGGVADKDSKEKVNRASFVGQAAPEYTYGKGYFLNLK